MAVGFSRRRVTCKRLLQTSIFISVLLCVFELVTSTQDDEFDEHLLCRTCGHEVAQADDLVRVTTSQALGQRNDTILGRENVLIQLLQNPQGRSFEVLTASKANVQKLKQAYAKDSWFEGYSWKLISCPHCRAHLGWFFEPIEETSTEKTATGDENDVDDDSETKKNANEMKPFYGLILNYLIHQQYADSLVIKPKIYGG